MSNHLRAVGEADVPDLVINPESGLPDFEGLPVLFSRLKLTSVADLEGSDEANRMDDIVRLFVEGRVVRVDHIVDEKTGMIKRLHTIKIIDAVQLPWDFDRGSVDG